jgi:hypothetical protein
MKEKLNGQPQSSAENIGVSMIINQFSESNEEN